MGQALKLGSVHEGNGDFADFFASVDLVLVELASRNRPRWSALNNRRLVGLLWQHVRLTRPGAEVGRRLAGLLG